MHIFTSTPHSLSLSCTRNMGRCFLCTWLSTCRMVLLAFTRPPRTFWHKSKHPCIRNRFDYNHDSDDADNHILKECILLHTPSRRHLHAIAIIHIPILTYLTVCCAFRCTIYHTTMTKREMTTDFQPLCLASTASTFTHAFTSTPIRCFPQQVSSVFFQSNKHTWSVLHTLHQR